METLLMSIEKGLQSSKRWIATLYAFLCNFQSIWHGDGRYFMAKTLYFSYEFLR